MSLGKQYFPRVRVAAGGSTEEGNNRKIVSRKDRGNRNVLEQETRGEMEGFSLM